MNLSTSYDVRLVRYEDIHSIQSSDFAAMVAACDFRGPCKVLDCGCGYGAVTREILNATGTARATGDIQLSIDLLDESHVQLNRARSELEPREKEPGVNLRFINGSFPAEVERSDYDVILCKMVLHEVPRDLQLNFVNGVHDHLETGVRFVFWDLSMSDEIAEFHRAVIRMKDVLAGYESMVKRRYLLTTREIEALFARSKFGKLAVYRSVVYRFETQKRFGPEFGGDQVKFAQWQKYVRELAAKLDPQVRNDIGYEDFGNNICFDVGKVIARAERVS